MRLFNILIVFFSLLIIASGSILFYFSPVLNPFPQPSGPYDVGLMKFAVTDGTRNELHSKDQNARRELLIELFYPSASLNKDTRYPYEPELIEALKKIKARDTKIPYFVWNLLLRDIKSYAMPDAPIAFDAHNAGYPVVLFSHGIGSPNLYSVYLEELASWGYIVASIHHTYDTLAVAFPDGRVVEIDSELKDMSAKNDRSRIYPYRAQAHKIWLEDFNFVLNELVKINNDQHSPFFGKLNLDRVGAMGHSHGGAVVTDFCKLDSRCKVGINLDGWTWTANSTDGFDKPFMFMVNESFDMSTPLTGGQTNMDLFIKNMQKQSNFYLEKIAHADHDAFSDGILLKWPVGSMLSDSEKARKEIQLKIKNFFDRFLKEN